MSVSRFPIPQTTQFNPAAWDFSFLDRFAAYFVTFPRTQNDLINFPESPTLTTRTALTQWADTAYATSEIVAWTAANVPALLPVAQTWAILQYYFGGIAVNTINPLTTGGTLMIGSSPGNTVYIGGKDSRSTVLHLGDGNTSSGSIHINNGTNATGNVNILDGTGGTGILTLGSSTSTTRLNSQYTRLYPYVVGTATDPNTPPIGTAGTIGFVAASTWITNATSSGAAGKSVRSVSLTPGVWIIAGTTRTSGFAGSHSLQFTGNPDSIAGTSYGKKGTWGYTAGQPTLPWGQAIIITLSVTTTIPLYLTQRNDNSTPINYSAMVAIKIA